MMQLAPEVDQLTFVIAEAMWGEANAVLCASQSNAWEVRRWDMAHRAAVAVLARRNGTDMRSARLYSDTDREGYRFLEPAEARR